MTQVALLDDEHRDRQWSDRHGDFWRWYEADDRCGWQYQTQGERWRFGGMHIPSCGPFTEVVGPRRRVGIQTPEWITELEALRAKATPGEWVPDPSWHNDENAAADIMVDNGQEWPEGVFADSEGLVGCATLHDARYVCALHAALPHLLALIRVRAQ